MIDLTEFAEQLPEHCPRPDAQPQTREGFWRFLMNPKWIDVDQKIREEAFSSQHGRNRPRPEHKDVCDWASCSMFDDDRAAAMRLIPPFKGKKSAKFNVPASAGPNRLDEGGHLHLWRLRGIDLSDHLVEVKDQ